MTTAVYVRISSDPTGSELGVQRQEAACRSLARRQGWEVAHVYADNDTSAFSGRPRPGYIALCEDVAAGRIRRVLAWHPDRLHRSPRELEDFISLMDRTGCEVHTDQAGQWDLSTPAGRMVARQIGAVARYESEHRSARTRARLQQRREAGLPHGGANRPYGWQEDRRTLDPVEAGHLHRAAELLLAGLPMKSVVRTLNSEGARNAIGGPWRDVTLRKTLLRPRNVREVVAQGVVLDGVVGEWEQLLDRGTYDAVRLLLTDPSRRTNPGRDGRVHLLATVARCGRCEGVLTAAWGKAYTPKKRGPFVGETIRKRVYKCMTAGCFGVTRDMAELDTLVTEYVLARLRRSDALALLNREHEEVQARERAELEDVRAQRDAIAADFGAGLITRSEWLAARSRLTSRVDALEAKLHPVSGRGRLLAPLVAATDLDAAWTALDDTQRRLVVRTLVDVRVNRQRPGPGFDPTAVEVRYLEDTPTS